MLTIFAGVAGLLAGFAIHSLTWLLRERQPSLTAVAGALSAVSLTTFFLLLQNSDIANIMLRVSMLVWGIGLGLGLLQARARNVPWWKGILGVFFEMGVAFLTGTVVNLGLQNSIPWFDRSFPGIDVYALINAFLWTLIIALLALAVLRPLILWRELRGNT